MTEEEVRARVDAIDEVADMPEKAHMEEDRLYRDVLRAIASGANDPAGLARAALAAQQLSIDRFYSPAVD